MLILQLPRRYPVHHLAFSPDGRSLASVWGRMPLVHFWDVEQRQVHDSLHGQNSRIVSVAFSPDGALFAVAGAIGELRVWRLGPPRSLARQVQWPREEAHAPGQVAFAPDGRCVATTMSGAPQGNAPHYRHHLDYNSINLVFVDRDRTVPMRSGHTAEVSSLAYSPDGRRLATGSFDRTVAVFDVASQERLFHLNQGQKVHYLAFSPDGLTLAAGNPQGLVKLWDLGTGKKRSTLKGQARPLRSLCYSPDGRLVATAGGEGVVTFWDVASGRVLTSFDWGVGEVLSVAFAPDGMRAAAGGVGQIVLWDLDWDL
jgi:WD40 repeat protein